jgi:hypothetical protein
MRRLAKLPAPRTPRITLRAVRYCSAARAVERATPNLFATSFSLGTRCPSLKPRSFFSGFVRSSGISGRAPQRTLSLGGLCRGTRPTISDLFEQLG